MKIYEITTLVCLVLMIVFVTLAFLTKDVINSQLFASLGIIAGGLITKITSTTKTKIDEKN